MYDNFSFMERNTALGVFAALAHEIRLDVFRFLVHQESDGATAGRIGEAVSVPPSTLTFHLNKLQKAALVNSRRNGRNLVYVACPSTIDELIAHLAQHYASASHAQDVPRRDSPLVAAVAASVVSFFGSKKYSPK